jgi:penicillin amidase
MKKWQRILWMALCVLVALFTLIAYLILIGAGHHMLVRCEALVIFMSIIGFFVFAVVEPTFFYYVYRSYRKLRPSATAHQQLEPVDQNDDNDNVAATASGAVELQDVSSTSSSAVPSASSVSKPSKSQRLRSWFTKKRVAVCGLWSLVLLVIVLVTILFCVYAYMLDHTIPQRSGTLSVPGLLDTVRVSRDENGAIKIEARNTHDAYFAQGYVAAQERLWQMEFQRRVTTGTLSALVGSGALKTDKFLRTMGFYRYSQMAYANMSPSAKLMADSYTEGVNAFLKEKKYQVEFHLFGYFPTQYYPAELIGWSKLMAYDLCENFNAEALRYDLLLRGNSVDRVMELTPLYPDDAPTILSRIDLNISDVDGAKNEARILNDLKNELGRLRKQWDQHVQSANAHTSDSEKMPARSPASYLFGRSWDTRQASNNWVFQNSRGAYLANDPHLTLMAPSLWLYMTITYPRDDGEQFWSQGVTLAGIPGIVIGRNKHLAWGVTNVGADVQDLYIIDQRSSSTYMHNGTLKKYKVRSERIEIAGEAPYVMQVRETLYGPVLTDEPEILDLANRNHVLSLRWTSLEPTDSTLEAFASIQVARNWDEFVSAFDTYVAPSQNFVYADVAGNIGYVMPGKIPVRVANHSGTFPVAGDGTFDWNGFIPRNELPRVLNPPEGFIVTANNRVPPRGYRHLITHDWSAPYRYERIKDLLISVTPDQVSANMMRSIQTDRTSYLWRDMRSFFLSLDPSKRFKGVDFESWDGNMKTKSKEASVFGMWMREMALFPVEMYNTGEDHWTSEFFLASAFGSRAPAALNDPVKTNYAKKALDRVVDQSFGRAPEHGETFHRAHIMHQVLGQSPLSCLSDLYCRSGGDFSTPNASPLRFKNYEQVHGASYRQVVVVDKAAGAADMQWVIPGSQTGNWIERDWGNLVDLWQDGKLISAFDSSSSVRVLELHSKLYS